jgi:thiamine-phosphate pyrophosphorylase
MRPRQSMPREWMIVADREALGAVKRLPQGGGLVVLEPLSWPDLRRLRQIARRRGLALIVERQGTAARVHNIRELRRALSARTPLILLSPIFPTQSHSDWEPIPRMRAAALARLAGRQLIALGGMDARRFARVRKLGFQGWAGISAFRT